MRLVDKETIMPKRTAFIFALIVFVSGFAAFAQETESRVPELEAFHEIIYPIWHTAYPEKDIVALKGFVPEINKLAGKIFEATLPGILRDKEAKWQAGLAEFKKSIEAYNAAVQGADDQALLNAAEVLHARYEMLVRTIRPVLNEMDDFHKVLYVVFHKSLPDKKFAEIKALGGDLRSKAEALTKATLSKRMEAKSVAFQAASTDVLKATIELETACQGDDNAAIESAVLTLHMKYQALGKIFD
jgi:hypothetical protein